VEGRTEITWPERVALDDLRILRMRILPVLKGEGVSPD
jgi:hypothetical protein